MGDENARHLPTQGWGEMTRTLVPWRQEFRHPTRNEYMGWFTQIKPLIGVVMDIIWNGVDEFPSTIAE